MYKVLNSVENSPKQVYILPAFVFSSLFNMIEMIQLSHKHATEMLTALS